MATIAAAESPVLFPRFTTVLNDMPSATRWKFHLCNAVYVASYLAGRFYASDVLLQVCALALFFSLFFFVTGALELWGGRLVAAHRVPLSVEEESASAPVEAKAEP
jgi:hypothetical protein